MKNKMYVGDGVYVEFTGYSIILTTENGEEVANTIHLEEWMLRTIKNFVSEVKISAKEKE